jgi:hypothetical protein
MILPHTTCWRAITASQLIFYLSTTFCRHTNFMFFAPTPQSHVNPISQQYFSVAILFSFVLSFWQYMLSTRSRRRSFPTIWEKLSLTFLHLHHPACPRLLSIFYLFIFNVKHPHVNLSAFSTPSPTRIVLTRQQTCFIVQGRVADIPHPCYLSCFSSPRHHKFSAIIIIFPLPQQLHTPRQPT